MASSGPKGARARAYLIRKAQALALREGMFPPGSRALIMVSGGQDSLALLDILSGITGRAGGPAEIRALHVNHHLRGPESDADEALVVRTCGERGVGLTVLHRPVEKAAGNVQESAREARREAALQTAAEHCCDRIALGHTADDQAETMLYRLGRYGGLAAFRAMLPCDPPWVRPLLEARRSETEAYCRQRGVEFALDRGNVYPGYARTAIRQELLPAFEAALPGAVESAARAAEVAGELERFTVGLLDEAERRVVLRRAVGVAARWGTADEPEGTATEAAAPAPAMFSASALLALEAPLRRLLLHRWLESCAGPSASRASVLAVEALLTVCGSAERDLGGGWRGVKVYDEVSLQWGAAQAKPLPAPGAVPLTVPGRALWGGTWVAAEAAERFRAPDVSREAFVDAQSLQGAVEVRGPCPGDRMQPLGALGTRKLQDILVDLRVPARERAFMPLVVCEGRVVWVCGLLVAEEGRITRQTTDIVRLSMGPADGQGASDVMSTREGDG